MKSKRTFSKSLFKKKGRRKISQHNNTHNITAISLRRVTAKITAISI